MAERREAEPAGATTHDRGELDDGGGGMHTNAHARMKGKQPEGAARTCRRQAWARPPRARAVRRQAVPHPRCRRPRSSRARSTCRTRATVRRPPRRAPADTARVHVSSPASCACT
eukprot:scaffold682_cov355-Prasinococcus_capsulatus_cf.AAC.3